jgi:Ca2+-binding EF-hand superfamily protein
LELSTAQRHELREAFDLFDADGTGTIDIRELRVALKALGFEHGREEFKQLLSELGKLNAQNVDFNDFLTIMITKMAEKDVRTELLKAFK